MDTQAPADSSDQVQEGWLLAVEAIAGRLDHIADRTVLQAGTAAAVMDTPPVVTRAERTSLPTAVDSVGEGQVHQVLELDTTANRALRPARRTFTASC